MSLNMNPKGVFETQKEGENGANPSLLVKKSPFRNKSYLRAFVLNHHVVHNVFLTNRRFNETVKDFEINYQPRKSIY
jgi:hypothetical protein